MDKEFHEWFNKEYPNYDPGKLNAWAVMDRHQKFVGGEYMRWRSMRSNDKLTDSRP